MKGFMLRIYFFFFKCWEYLTIELKKSRARVGYWHEGDTEGLRLCWVRSCNRLYYFFNWSLLLSVRGFNTMSVTMWPAVAPVGQAFIPTSLTSDLWVWPGLQNGTATHMTCTTFEWKLQDPLHASSNFFAPKRMCPFSLHPGMKARGAEPSGNTTCLCGYKPVGLLGLSVTPAKLTATTLYLYSFLLYATILKLPTLWLPLCSCSASMNPPQKKVFWHHSSWAQF